MNFDKQEAQVIQETIDAATAGVTELAEMQLVIIGGGCGEVIFG